MAKVIAIDGPSASGKSTVAKAVAKRLGFFYVDSGAIYRGITWHALENGIDIRDADAVIENIRLADWVFRAENNVALFSINGYTPVDELRTVRLNEAVSDVASMPKVRAFVNAKLRELTELGSLTIDGRDIGSVVFPDTPYKFYLDADPAERAQRRYRELLETGEAEKAQEVLESLKRRDAKDSSREEAPLKIADGAYVINSTAMTIDEVVRSVIDRVGGQYPMNETRTETMDGMRMHRVSTLLFKIFFLIWNRLRIRGVKNIPATGGVLLATNHASILDPGIVGAASRIRQVHFLARDSLWNSKLFSWWMTKVGCIPVSRGTGDMRALRTMIAHLKNGSCVALFPEGTRTEDGELQDAKGGAGFIVEKSGCCVVPAYIDGPYKAYPKGARWIKPVKITITFGKPITQEEFAALGKGREAYDKHAALIMQRIAQLKAEPFQPTQR